VGADAAALEHAAARKPHEAVLSVASCSAEFSGLRWTPVEGSEGSSNGQPFLSNDNPPLQLTSTALAL